MCEKTTDDATEIEITPEMVEAGYDEILKCPIFEPSESELRETVIRVFSAMDRLRRRSF